jgi:ABC-type Fe3+-hydroxamate transport system, periplasmic component
VKEKIISVSVIILLLMVSFNASAKVSSFVDKSGNRVIIEKPFKRIVSLYGAHTENLFSLGLNRGIIGVSKNEAYPPQVMTKPVFSYHDDAEKFMAAHPDLVLIRPMIARGYRNLVLKLQKAGITVVSLQPRTVKEMYSYWRELGMLTGKETEAEKMIAKFRNGVLKIDSLVKSIPLSNRKRVYFEAIHSKMKTFSPSSIAIFVLKSAGATNVADDAEAVRETNIAAYGKERILSHANKIDIYLAQRGAMNRAKVRRIMEEGGFKAIKAVRDGEIHIIDEKIVSRPTLRLLDGIYEIGRILYPERFNNVTIFKKRHVITKAEFAEMFVKMMNIPLKTPDYRHDIQRRSDTQHKYGDFSDVDYTGSDYKFIETAVYKGLFDNVDKCKFYPDAHIKKEMLRTPYS